jgi:threonine dehydratase
MVPEKDLIEQDDILAAREVIAGRVHRRGVLNKLHHLSPEDKQKGVITLSAGNHAQALAWAATQSGILSTVVMPATSVRSKIEATRSYGGEVILTEGDLLETCLTIQKERGLTLVHPFDDPMIIAGQGTVGLEILEDVPEVDAVVVGVGGGGLISGIATALKAEKPEVKVIGVEPEGASAMTQSLQRGEPVHLDRVDTVADGLAAPFAGQHTLAHVQTYVDDMVIVSDQEIVEAMGLILERCKVVAEPAAASTLAALLSGKVSLPRDSTVVCVLSGGNIDRERLKALL